MNKIIGSQKLFGRNPKCDRDRMKKELKNKWKKKEKGSKKDQIEKGNKSSIKKKRIKVQIEIRKSKLAKEKKSFLRPQCKIAVKNSSTWFEYFV